MKRQTGWIERLAVAALIFVSGGVCADEDRNFTMIAGYDSSSGKYGTASTNDIVSIPVSALYETGNWALKLTVPYLQVTGEGDVIASGGHGGRRGSTTTTTTTRTTRSGMGDIVTMATYNLYSADESDSGAELTGRIKFGTASKMLGTGENDYAAQLFAYHALGDFSPGLMAGYEVLGSSAELPMNNVYYGSVGGDYKFSGKTRGGAEYKYAQQATATGAELRELTLYASHQVSSGVYLRGYLLKGYSDASPDSGFGLSISSAFK